MARELPRSASPQSRCHPCAMRNAQAETLAKVQDLIRLDTALTGERPELQLGLECLKGVDDAGFQAVKGIEDARSVVEDNLELDSTPHIQGIRVVVSLRAVQRIIRVVAHLHHHSDVLLTLYDREVTMLIGIRQIAKA